MSVSEAGGVIASRDSFTVATIPKSPAPAKSIVQNMSFPYTPDGTIVYKPVPGSSPPYQPGGEGSAGVAGSTIVPNNLNLSSGEPMKRKRGRPRKYGPDGSIAMVLVSGAAATPNPPVTMTPSGGNFSPTAAASPPSGTPSIPSSSMKKAKGRPPASSKKQQVEALGSVGIGFMPHVITVKAGEDVSAKIMSFSQQGPRAICILSANGAISNVTLRQAATFGGTATYEGRFDILSLSGSFLLSEVGGQRSRTGGLSVSLAGPDGRVLGGCVAGLLIAASPVQVVVGSFIADGHKESKSMNHFEPSSAPLKVNPGGASGASSPPSRGTFSESSAGPGSPHNQSTGACNNFNPQGISSMAWK